MEEEINPLRTIITLNYINKPVSQLEEEIKLKTNGFDKIQKWHTHQVYQEMQGYLTYKLDVYGFNNEEGFDELARTLVFTGKSIVCELAYGHILKQAKLEGVSPRKYIDDAFAIRKPQGIISSLVPDEKQVSRA